MENLYFVEAYFNISEALFHYFAVTSKGSLKKVLSDMA